MNVSDATTSVRTYCENHGIAASPERLATLGKALADAVEWDAVAGRHFVLDAEGNRMIGIAGGQVYDLDPVEWLGQLTKADPRKSARKPATPASAQPSDPAEWIIHQVNGSTSVRRADDPFVRIANSIAGERDAAVLAEMQNWPNPWAKEHLNRTRQTLITNKNPALAAKLKAAA